MTYKEIESLDRPELEGFLATKLFAWAKSRVAGEGAQKRAEGAEKHYSDPLVECPDWTGNEVWLVVEELRHKGFRVNIAEIAPNVGEVIVVEHSPKHPKQDRVEVTTYYGLADGMDTCAVALCRAALMAITTPMRTRAA